MTKLSQQVNTKVTKVVTDAERNKSAFLCTSHLLTFLHSSMNVFFISCLKGDHISVEHEKQICRSKRHLGLQFSCFLIGHLSNKNLLTHKSICDQKFIWIQTFMSLFFVAMWYFVSWQRREQPNLFGSCGRVRIHHQLEPSFRNFQTKEWKREEWQRSHWSIWHSSLSLSSLSSSLISNRTATACPSKVC